MLTSMTDSQAANFQGLAAIWDPVGGNNQSATAAAPPTPWEAGPGAF